MMAMPKHGTDCTSTDGLVALIFQCGSDTEAYGSESANVDLDRLKRPNSATVPLGEAALRTRGYCNLRHKRVESIFYSLITGMSTYGTQRNDAGWMQKSQYAETLKR